MNSERQKFYSLFVIFLFAQPFIDVVTSLNTRASGSLLTIGTYLRFAFMIVGLVYVLIQLVKERKTLPIVFLVLSGLSIVLSFGINYVTKKPFWTTTELRFDAKAAYFIVMLYIGYFYARQLNDTKRLVRNLAWINFFVSVFLLVPTLIGAGFNSYHYLKSGSTGFFFSANQTGGILAMLSPFAVYYGLTSPFRGRNLYRWIPALFSLFAMYIMGTKVAFLSGIVIVLFAFIVVIRALIKSQELFDRKNLYVFIVLGIIMLGLTPMSPAIHNTQIQAHDQHLGLVQPGDPGFDPNIADKKQPIEVRINKHVHSHFLRVILNNRDRFFFNRYHDFKQASIERKLFGLGYAGDYQDHPKMVEMDLLDDFISFGIIGCVLYLLPFLYFFILSIIYFIGFMKRKRNTFHAFVWVSLILGFGISFIAGHVIYEPSDSIYLGLITALLYVQTHKAKETSL